MFEIEKAANQELTFYESFTNRLDAGFGIIYYNLDNPLSHDSNHAHILRIGERPGEALQEIKRFYNSRGLTPRIYPSFVDNELEILRPHLESEGFTISIFDSVDMYFPFDSSPLTDLASPARRITYISEDIIELIHTDDSGDWTIKVLQKHINDTRFHLLGYFYQGRYVSIASVKTLEGYSIVNDVVTHKEYRGRGFGTRLIGYLVGYHANISDNYLYLWADNPVAIRMYQRVGFKDVPVSRPHWSAFVK